MDHTSWIHVVGVQPLGSGTDAATATGPRSTRQFNEGTPVVRKNPLGMIKDVAARPLKVPARAVGATLGLAKGAASVARAAGAQVTRTAAGKAPAAATSQVGGRRDSKEAAGIPKKTARRPDPVNVTEELGLDPAPVEKTARSKKAPRTKPITDIDAAADPSAVDATPADLAEVVAHQAAVKKPAK